jgi:signal transduction histidine kinase
VSLRSRLFGAIGMTLCVVLAVVVWVAVGVGQERARASRDLYEASLEFASLLAVSHAPDYLTQTGLVGEDGLDARLSAVVVVDRAEDGRLAVTAEYGPLRGDAALSERARAAAAGVFESARSAPRDGRAASLGVPMRDDRSIARGRRRSMGSPLSVVYVEMPRLEGAAADPGYLGRVVFVTVVGAGLVLLLVTWFIVDRVVAGPLSRVVEAAGRVADGDYSRPVAGGGGDDEIQKVIVAMNSMMVDLDSLQDRMKDHIGEAVREARKTQDSLVIAQRLAATGRLAAGIAHEVNNPLAGMLNAVRSLRTKQMTPEKQAEYLVLVEEGLQRIQRTVAKILQFTPHKVAPRPLSLEDVVRPVLALAKHRVESDAVSVIVELSETPATVFGDLYELQQAALNVVLNALDAMGDVPEQPSELLIRTSVEDGECRVLVRDNGPGMPPEDLDRAFDLFFTTKETGKGSGMGLATVHKILTDHGGRVDLRVRGSGTGVEVELVWPEFTG